VKVPAEVEKTKRGRDIPVSAAWLQSLKAIPRTAQDAIIYLTREGQPRKSIREAFDTAVENAKLTGLNLTPYCLRRTRISAWDQVDAAAGRLIAGHSPIDIHEKHYVNIGRQRLFRLVGIEFDTRMEYRIAAAG
jgi:hypothetical protein